MYGQPSNPALSTLGDRLEAAAGTAIVTGHDRPPRRRWVLAPVAALLVLAVVGALLVLPTGGGDTAAASVQSAAQQTTDASTGRFELTAEASGLTGLGSETVSVRVDGAYDLPADRYTASLDLASLASAVPDALEGAVEDGPVEGASIDAVVDGDDVYLRLGPVLSALGIDAEWVHATAPELTQGSAESPVPPLQDPGALLDALEGLGTDLAEVGREQVRGVDTTHYEGTLSTADALDSLEPDERADLEAALGGLLAEVALPDVPVGVWIDDDGFVRRISLALDGSALGVPEADAAGFAVTLELYDLGEPVTIEVPPAEATLDADELLADVEGLVDGLEVPNLDDLDELLEGLELPEELGDLDAEELEDLLEEELGDLFGDEQPGSGSDGGGSGGGPADQPGAGEREGGA